MKCYHFTLYVFRVHRHQNYMLFQSGYNFSGITSQNEQFSVYNFSRMPSIILPQSHIFTIYSVGAVHSEKAEEKLWPF